MKTKLGWLCALMLLAAVPVARAQDPVPAVLDSGRFTIRVNGKPVGVEEFEYDRLGDSLMVSATHTRTGPAGAAPAEPWTKSFGLVVGAEDFGLRSYISNMSYGGHVYVRGVTPGDTVLTVYNEVDGAGEGAGLEQPPGRLFVMDPMLFTLFDVICRNISAHGLSRRPVEMVTLGNPAATVEAIATVAGTDTLRWNGRRVPAKRWTLQDEHSTFVVWASPAGQMLRLVHEPSGLEVTREQPKPAARAARPKPRAR